jgi:hypothetical protein
MGANFVLVGGMMDYKDTDFNYWKSIGDKLGEHPFSTFMKQAYNIDVKDKPNGQKGIDFSNLDETELYEVRTLGKEMEDWQLNLLGMEYPMCFDEGKMIRATEFYNTHITIPQYVFLRTHFQKHWAHLNGVWVIGMGKFLNQYWKDKERGKGLYQRAKRKDEIETGKTNACKWHIELEQFIKIVENGKVLRDYKGALWTISQ